MARGSKAKYTNKQKRQARDIERGYMRRGIGRFIRPGAQQYLVAFHLAAFGSCIQDSDSRVYMGSVSDLEMLRQIAVFTLRLDWTLPGLDYWGMKSLDCTLGSADKRPFCDVASVTAPYRSLDGRLAVRASTVATAFRLRGCFFLWHPSPEYDAPQSHFRFGSPLLENHRRDQCEAC